MLKGSHSVSKEESKTLREIKKIAVVGAGLMGHEIAQAFSQKDYTVTLGNLSPSILETALSQILKQGTRGFKDRERVLSI